MDRRTNRPEGSGGASPTVVASRTGGDPADDGDLGGGRDGAAVTRAPQPGKPAASKHPAPSRDTRAADGKPPDASAQDRPAGADGVPALPGDVVAADKASPLPADTIGTFTRPVSVPVSPDGDRPATGDPVRPRRGDRAPAAPIGKASFRAEPDAPAAPPQAANPAPSSTEPQPTATSGGALRWQPGPERSSATSAERAFLRAGASPDGSTPTSADGPAATAVPPRAAPPPPKRSARQAHLTVARIEPWSVMKFSFVVSLVAFVILFVAVSLLYGALAGLGVFQSLQHVVSNVTSSQDSAGLNTAHWFSASRVLGYTALLGSLNIVLITAMATIGAVIYNLSSRLVGGVEVTLRETE